MALQHLLALDLFRNSKRRKFFLGKPAKLIERTLVGRLTKAILKKT